MSDVECPGAIGLFPAVPRAISVIVGAASRQAVNAVGFPSAREGEQGIESVRRLQGGAPSARALANSSPSAFIIYGKDQNN